MIHGFFDPNDLAQRPWVTGILYLPRLNLTRVITLEVDTGADMTMLAYRDRIGFIDPTQQFERMDTGGGTAGVATYGRETAVLAFEDAGSATGWYGRAISLWIALSAQASPGFSLLGRDFLGDVVLTMDMSARRVDMDPIIPIAPQP